MASRFSSEVEWPDDARPRKIRPILNYFRIHLLSIIIDGRWGFFAASNPQFLDRSEIVEALQKYPSADMYQN